MDISIKGLNIPSEQRDEFWTFLADVLRGAISNYPDTPRISFTVLDNAGAVMHETIIENNYKLPKRRKGKRA